MKIILKDITLTILVFLVAIAFLYGFSQFYNPIIRESPTSKTRYILDIVATTIDNANKGNDIPKNELRTWVQNNGLNKYLPNPMWRPQKYFKGIDNTYDFYGNPLNIEYIEKFPPNKPVDSFKRLKYGLVIWSSGENGINEWGKGDDIVY